ncbi:MAG: hypothetical protein HY735_05110 [Verrucomicrobia bacterium]|nr:hypothetical protein [Verrucomicrobiota bacterium]
MRRFDLMELLAAAVAEFNRVWRQIGEDDRYSQALVTLFKLLLAAAFIYGFFRTIELFR